MSTRSTPAVMVTGASGCLGNLSCAALLAKHDCRIVVPLRDMTAQDRVIEEMQRGGRTYQHEWTDRDRERLEFVQLPPIDRMDELAPMLRDNGVREIVHSAGCVDYFDTQRLREGNIDLTNAMLRLGDTLQVDRFFFVSTAFSSGYQEGIIREELHPEGAVHPTEYTESKRQAELLVAGSGLPWVILRPSIVIGNSFDGTYWGKNYGLYQLWAAAERILCSKYLPILHVFAPESTLQLLHQDGYQQAFLGAFEKLEPESIMHITSNPATLPTKRQIWDLFVRELYRPRKAFYYERGEDIPRDQIDKRLRMWADFAAVNLEISGRGWAFETSALDKLRADGLNFVDASIKTLRTCQETFIAQSGRIQKFLSRFEKELRGEPEVVLVD